MLQTNYMVNNMGTQMKKGSWKYILATCNIKEGEQLDTLGKYLLLVRPCVFPMTLISALIGGLLALEHVIRNNVAIDWGVFIFNWLLVTFALVLAHATNNMLNDYFDFKSGVDDEEYIRAQYAPHPLISGLVTEKQMKLLIIGSILLFLAITTYFAVTVSPMVIIFAVIGLFISIFYVTPPVQLKHIALGELGVLIVWGPAMVGATYFVLLGEISVKILVLSLPYALLVTTVLMGKHVDKYDIDSAKKIHTLPVVLGKKTATYLTLGMMGSFYALIVLAVIFRYTGIGILVGLVGIHRLIIAGKIFLQPKPTEKPENYPVWPLWYVGWAFWHTQLAGSLFVLGLILNILLLIFFPNIYLLNI